MAKGENIFRRRDGRWEARYSKGRELSGKIKYGYCYGKTYREAKEKAEKCKAALASGKLLHAPGIFIVNEIRLCPPRARSLRCSSARASRRRRICSSSAARPTVEK